MKPGGERISSVELEGHLLAHPGVADVEVVDDIPNTSVGEIDTRLIRDQLDLTLA